MARTSDTTRRRLSRVFAVPSALFLGGFVALATTPMVAVDLAQELAQADPVPREHFRVRDPANITPAQAEAIHQAIGRDMAARYAISHHVVAENYVDWPRHNSSPYRSATHGARYVSQYTNALAKDYAQFERAGTMPAGAIVVKDSFTALSDGDIYPGPLFIMEKMEAGFYPPSGDWRYTMIMPDGSLFGETKGEGSENVAFCVGCHAAMSHQDHLFFVPPEFRRITAD